MIYFVCTLAGAAAALGIIVILLRFRRTGDFIKKAAEKLSRYKSKTESDELTAAFLNLMNY